MESHIKQLNEDKQELSETTLKAIESAKKDIRAGRVYSSKKIKITYIPIIIFMFFLLLLGIIFVVFVFLPFLILKTLFLGLTTRLAWHPKKKYMLFIYSNSPNWKDYLEKKILPKISDKSVILNWSERNNWNWDSLETKIFKHWANLRQYHPKNPENKFPYKEFCPMAITFIPWWHPKSIRFWKAFKDLKHGKEQKLKECEKKLFEILSQVKS